MIVTNETVAPLYLKKIQEQIINKQCEVVVLPDGEKYKNLTTLNMIFDQLLIKNHNRTTTLVALGGGVIGDMTGFAASCYQRGVSFIQVPTTLLAQVDSSVGGKTGVNHELGKNMIGAFYQPVRVVIDIDTLNTLPEREFRSGLAEIIKYGLITDINFFEWLEKNMENLVDRNPDVLIEAISISCKTKASIVNEDEKEMGKRALLNLGHTFGHAIESWQKYTGLLHGEAVAVGTVIAAIMSHQIGYIGIADVKRVIDIMKIAGLPFAPPENMTAQSFIEYMQRDKKNINEGIRLILLKSIGCGLIIEKSSLEDIKLAIDACRDLHLKYM